MQNAALSNSKPTYEQLLEENRFLKHVNKNLQEDNSYLEELVRHLKRQRFASKSEIYAKGQGTLFNEAEFIAPDIDDAENAEDTDNKGKRKRKKRGRPVRRPLPDHLPRVENIIDLPENEKYCRHSGEPLAKIGEEVSEQLDIEPTKAKVIRTIRNKYGCNCPICQSGNETPTMKTAEVEAQPIPKSMAAAGLLAYIAVAKYADALPLNRLEGIFKRSKIELKRATMASWMILCGELVIPLINLVRDELLKGQVIQADETPVQVHKGTGKKATAKSYMWAFSRDGPNGSKIILYELGPSRGHEVPLRFLEGFSGYLHTDGYEAYNTLAVKMPSLTLVGDWVHVRRKFDDAFKATPKGFKGEIKAKVGLEMINELFRIEREDIGKDASLDERFRIRQEKSKPVVEALKDWADKIVSTVPPKTLTGIALSYFLKQWPKLSYFLNDPILRLDTNPIENAIRPFVIGRKNWLFADTVKGAEASASLYSLIIMARSAGHDPFEYMKSVFTALPKAKTVQDLESLLPWRWKPTAK